MNASRNEPCPCGSGQKFKRCCGKISDEPVSTLHLISPAPIEHEQLVALFHAGDYAELERRAHLLLEKYPESGFAWKLLGTALGVQGKDALFALQKAAELLPEDVDAHNNLGNALQDLGLLEGAEASYRRALEIKPDFASAQYNLGITLLALGQFDSALACYCRALEINPEDADAHGNYSYLLLSEGKFDYGWQEYEWRSARRAVEERFQASLPKAKSLLPFTCAGKRILLCHEQGIGDELFFLRFAQQLRGDAQWVGYLSTPKVLSLIERSGCVDQVLSQLDQDIRADFIIPVGDLPLLLGCHAKSNIPKPLKLTSTEQQVAKVRRHLSDLGLFGQRLLGVTWRAGVAPVPGQTKTLFKHIGLDLLADAIKNWNGAIVVLQRSPTVGEIEQLRAHVSCPVYDLSEYNNDLEAMLALLDVLDEYVGVSNANMHLLAGLGKVARVLIPAPAEWRWMAGGDESPWFPGFSLYRQTFSQDWEQALGVLSRHLLSTSEV